MHIKEQGKDRAILIKHNNCQLIRRENSYVGPSTKTQSILHELIPQIPLFWNYENCLHAY